MDNEVSSPFRLLSDPGAETGTETGADAGLCVDGVCKVPRAQAQPEEESDEG